MSVNTAQTALMAAARLTAAGIGNDTIEQAEEFYEWLESKR